MAGISRHVMDEDVSTGVKRDDGKLRYDLFPPEAYEALVEVLTFGAEKYGDRNWEDGIPFDRLYAAVERHLQAYRLGEAADPESGLSHLAHAATSLLFLLTFERRQVTTVMKTVYGWREEEYDLSC